MPFPKSLSTTSLFLILGAAIAVPLQAKPTKITLPTTPPDTVLTVKRESGQCPKQVGIWTAFRYYEGGGEHTVIANTRPIAAPVKLTTSGQQVVEYQSALNSQFASCVGKTVSVEDNQYSLRFRQGILTFRVDLSQINQNPSTPTRITYKAILAGRPYVRWAIAD